MHTESTDDAALRMGERRHWLSSYYPVRTADGEVIGIGAVIMEITDRKRADDRLRLLAEAGELFSSSLDQRGDRLADRAGRGAEARRHLQRLPRRRDDAQARRLRQRRPGRSSRCSSRCPRRSRSASPSRAGSRTCSGRPSRCCCRPFRPSTSTSSRSFGVDPAAFARIGTRSLMLVPDRRPRPDARGDHARLAAAGAVRRARPRPRAGARRPRRRRDGQRPAGRRASARAPRLRRRSSSSATASSWSAATG